MSDVCLFFMFIHKERFGHFFFFKRKSNPSVMVWYHLAEVDWESLDNRYFCTHCGFVLWNTLQTKCGHLYCANCLSKLYDDVVGQYVCHEDRIVLTREETFADQSIRREIANLIVHCTHAEKDCSWKGEWKSLDGHLTCCEWVEIECIHRECGQWVWKNSLADHLEKYCPFRLISCSACEKPLPPCQREQHERDECSVSGLSTGFASRTPSSASWRHHRKLQGFASAVPLCLHQLCPCFGFECWRKTWKHRHFKIRLAHVIAVMFTCHVREVREIEQNEIHV